MNIIKKNISKIIIIFLLVGIIFWLLASIIELFNINDNSITFLEILLINIPKGSLLIRIFSVVFIYAILFGGLLFIKSIPGQIVRYNRKRVNKYLNSIGLMMIFADNNCEVKYVNKYVCEFFNFSEKNILNKKIYEINLPDEINNTLRLNHKKLINNQEINDVFQTIEVKASDNKLNENRYIRWKNVAINHDGYSESLLIAEDITDKVITQQRLERNEMITRKAVVGSPFPIMIHCQDHEIMMLSNKWLEVTEYENDEIKDVYDWVKLGHRAEKDTVLEAINSIFENDERLMVSKFNVITRRGEIRKWKFFSNIIGHRTDGRKISMTMAIDITDREKKEKLIKDLAKFPDENPYPIIRVSRNNEILYSNKTGKELIDYACDDPDKSKEYIHLLKDSMESGYSNNIEVEINNKIYYITINPIKNEDYINIYGHDITELKKARNDLKLIAKVFENSNEGIVITDSDANIIRANNAFLDITGYSRPEVIGKNPRIIKSNKHDGKFYKAMWATLLTRGYWKEEIWNRRKNGEIYPALLSITVIRDEHDAILNFIGMSMDISRVKESENKIRQLTNYDPLTNIPNRTLLVDRLQQALIKAELDDRIHMIAVLSIDIDNFKIVNETLGHRTGDTMLIEITERIEHVLGKSDTIARLGADEFIIVLTKLTRTIEAASLTKKIMEEIASPFHLESKEFITTISVGIAVSPFDGKSTDQLIKNANTAMHYVKRNGKNNYKFYSQNMNITAIERLEMETMLRRALERDEFLLYYQPKYDFKEQRITGMEALIRWDNPTLGLVSPVKFIPLAEETGLIIDIGEWVINTACKDTQKLIDNGHKHLRVAVNLSSKQFEKRNIIDIVHNAIEISGLNPDCLELEITESIIMRNAKYMITKLYELKENNIKLAIDDFGTGYSSLSYLKYFPIDTVKIDRSFVRDLETDIDNQEISKAIIALSHSLKFNVVAEGVENMEQLEFLRNYDCDYIQGYYISKPVPIDKFENLLREGTVY